MIMERPQRLDLGENEHVSDEETISSLAKKGALKSMTVETKISRTVTASVSITVSKQALEDVPLLLSEKGDQVGSIKTDQNARAAVSSVICKVQLTMTRKSSTGKILSCEGFSKLKRSLIEPHHIANMEGWVHSEAGRLDGPFQLITQNFVKVLMNEGNVDQGGVLTLRNWSLSQVELADDALSELKKLSPASKIGQIKKWSSDLNQLRINAWPLFVVWCHFYIALDKIFKQNTPDSDSEQKRYKDMLVDIADLLSRLEKHVGDISCLEVLPESKGKYENYFHQNVEIHPRQEVLKFETSVAQDPGFLKQDFPDLLFLKQDTPDHYCLGSECQNQDCEKSPSYYLNNATEETCVQRDSDEFFLLCVNIGFGL